MPHCSQMKSNSDAPQLYVQKIGQTAHGLLTPGRRGKVLAAFSNAVYMLSDQEELFWLATVKNPMHHCCMQLSGPLPRAAVDTPFTVKDQHLTLGADIILDFSQAFIWEAPLISPKDAAAITDLPERVCTIFSVLSNLIHPVGFGNLIPEIFSIAIDCNAPRRSQKLTGIPALAWPVIQEITKACLAHDISRVLQQANALVGLGEGLTPSGDDFVGGLLFCKAMLQCHYPGFFSLAPSVQADLIETAKPSTNIISYTMLKEHAEGHAAETLHRFVNALLTHQSLERVCQLGSELAKIGHSTGWDLLAGVLTGMLLTFPVSTPVRPNIF